MASLTFSHSLPPVREREQGSTGRPSFSSRKTSDRLSECERRPSKTSRPKPRRSAFKEEGLDDLSTSVHSIPVPDSQEKLEDVLKAEIAHSKKREASKASEDEDGDSLHSMEFGKGKGHKKSGSQGWNFKFRQTRKRPMLKSSATAPPGSFSSMPRVAMIVFLVAVVVPGFRYSAGNNGAEKVVIPGADAGIIREPEFVENASSIMGRANSPTEVCTRWSHQVANVNGTVYIYGGNSKTSSGQTSNTWNNNLLSLDLTKTWQISLPLLSGLPQPTGPPAVALGSLWHSYTSLFLYGGMFSDDPSTPPLPVSTWEYDLASSTWIEHPSPQTSAGNNSDVGNQPVQRSAEGAGISIPMLGRSYYFGGHLDMYTTPGWSNQIFRVYLKSMLEFTHPGYANSGVQSLGTTTAAGKDGVYRNITQGGLQDEAGFTERADGVLVYVPGWGDEGILLGLTGGTNLTFTENNIIDIYDIANSTWYKQATSGPSPPIRVNPCAIVAAAPDGSSFNIYLYGGQNLVPFGSQIQYSDMWILTIPSFTWIQVDMSGQSQPPARAGHSCVMWDGQMVVIGGYVGRDISCDSPGIYVFNTSSLQWQNTFTALSIAPGPDPKNKDPDIVQGSAGYRVPALVQSIVGGSSAGGATVTQPAAGSATAGPIATGKPPTFTVTNSGSVVTQTSTPGPGSNTTTKDRKGAIIAGVIAGILFLLALYLAFCTWLYRRQLAVYKNHVAMGQRTAFAPSPDPGTGADQSGGSRVNEKGVVLGPFGTDISGSGRPSHASSSGASGNMGLTSSSGVTPNSGPTPGSAYSPNGRQTAFTEEGMGYNGAANLGGRTADSSTEDLLAGQEPSFFSVVLNPRRTLRVVNSD